MEDRLPSLPPEGPATRLRRLEFLKEFRAFVVRGNMVELAVAVVVGAAFNAVVNAIVKQLFTPLISIPGKAQFASYEFHLGHSAFGYGAVLNELISFVLIAAVVFFVVVKPMNHLKARLAAAEETAGAAKRDCPECLSEIPVAARRCAFCTSEVEAVA